MIIIIVSFRNFLKIEFSCVLYFVRFISVLSENQAFSYTRVIWRMPSDECSLFDTITPVAWTGNSWQMFSEYARIFAERRLFRTESRYFHPHQSKRVKPTIILYPEADVRSFPTLAEHSRRRTLAHLWRMWGRYLTDSDEYSLFSRIAHV